MLNIEYRLTQRQERCKRRYYNVYSCLSASKVLFSNIMDYSQLHENLSKQERRGIDKSTEKDLRAKLINYFSNS